MIEKLHRDHCRGSTSLGIGSTETVTKSCVTLCITNGISNGLKLISQLGDFHEISGN